MHKPALIAISSKPAIEGDYHYEAFEVYSETWDAHNIGDSYAGGVIVDGLIDNDRDKLLFLVRFVGPAENWQEKFENFNKNIATIETKAVVAGAERLKHLGASAAFEENIKKELMRTLVASLLQLGEAFLLAEKVDPVTQDKQFTMLLSVVKNPGDILG